MKKRDSPKELRPYETIIPNWIIEDGLMAKVGIYAWAVYTVLAEHHNWQTGYCFPSYETIMKKTGIKDQHTIANAIDTLQKARLISYEYQRSTSKRGKEFGIGKHTYVLTYPAGAKYVPKSSPKSHDKS